MTEKYVRKGVQVNDQERELLVVTMEECGEVVEVCADMSRQCATIIYECSKTIRFGKEDKKPNQPERGEQTERLATELGQLLALVDRLVECHVISPEVIHRARMEKHTKLERYLQHS